MKDTRHINSWLFDVRADKREPKVSDKDRARMEARRAIERMMDRRHLADELGCGINEIEL